MSTVLDMLSQQMGSGVLSQLSQHLGTDEKATESAMSAALPMILGGLSRNAAKPDGAQALLGALDRDHDGSVLDDITGALNNPNQDDGNGILKHVLGNRRNAVESGVSRASGLDAGSVGKLMTMLAPLVMGALGRQRRQQQLDTGGLSDLLSKERHAVEKDAPGLSPLTRLLDADGDGQILDDLVGKIGLLSRLFGRK